LDPFVSRRRFNTLAKLSHPHRPSLIAHDRWQITHAYKVDEGQSHDCCYVNGLNEHLCNQAKDPFLRSVRST
jgi:hypothetical protein